MERSKRRSATVRRTVAAAVALTGAVVGCAPTSGPGAAPVKVVADGLNGPLGLTSAGGDLYVAEGESGEVTRIDGRTGGQEVILDGLRSPAAVARSGGRTVVVTGGTDVPDASITGDATVFVADTGGAQVPLADLEAYELAENPDGQRQFDPETGEPLDALSNPFAMITQRGPGLVLVADGGANAVLSVAEDGTVSTFFVPPVITTGACEGVPNNDPEHMGCDSVPTGLAYGPDGALYVSTLNGDAPGEGRVYVLDAVTGAVREVIEGFSGPTGVAVAPDGTVFVSEVLFGAPAPDAPPADGFDPASIGRIVRVSPSGERATAAVTMPTGLRYTGGRLYASAWSIASFFGMTDVGQVVAVRPSAFTPVPVAG